jgi:hypothetical protein
LVEFIVGHYSLATITQQRIIINDLMYQLKESAPANFVYKAGVLVDR